MYIDSSILVDSDILDWEYYSEGGHNLLLRYIGIKVELQGKLIRVRKFLHNVHLDQIISVQNELDYFSSCKKWLSEHYLANSSEFTFSRDSTIKEVFEIISKNKVGRISCRTETHVFSSSYPLQLLPNLTILNNHLPEKYHYDGISFSVELKVKCGLLSCSPFSLCRKDIHALKSTYSPYAIVQLARAGESNDHSHLCRLLYCPRDLCSRDEGRVRCAVRRLVSNPPCNNLKVCVDGNHVHGWNLAGLEAVRMGWCSLLGGSHNLIDKQNCGRDDGNGGADGKGDVHSNGEVDGEGVCLGEHLDGMCDVIARLLCTETLLPRLERLQALDVLGVEGCALVFRRLERLLGDEARALRAVQEALGEDLDPVLIDSLYELRTPRLPGKECGRDVHSAGVLGDRERAVQDMRDGDFRSVHTDTDATALLDQLQMLLVLPPSSSSSSSSSSSYSTAVSGVLEHEGEHEDESEQARRYEEAERWALSLSATQCILLLRMWLVALAASDASGILTMRSVSSSPSSSSSFESSQSSHDSATASGAPNAETGVGVRVIQAQSEDFPGICVVGSSASASSLAYSLTAIDVGPKPVGKILQRREQDDRRCELALRGLRMALDASSPL